MSPVQIDLGERSYFIVVENDVLRRCTKFLARLKTGNKLLLVSNPTVFRLHGEMLLQKLVRNGYEVTVAKVPDGEEHKNLQEAERLYDTAFSAGLERNSTILALGGGVIGDLAGFVASTYMRGIPFVQLPTTLLAQVDSSVGGKVAVNHPRGKNIIGSFYQPALVLADPSVLGTLPVRELRAGLAEIIKYGVIRDEVFFNWLEANIDALLDLDLGVLSRAIEQSCKLKAAIVEEDEREEGLRAVLNFGHTVGHALESVTGYKVYRHGEAVAIGMASASRLAERMGMLEAAERKRVEKLLTRAGLPTERPDNITTQELLLSIENDKKVTGGEITFVLPSRVGQVTLERGIPRETLKKHLS